MIRVILRTVAFAILFGVYMVGSAAFYDWAAARHACLPDSKLC